MKVKNLTKYDTRYLRSLFMACEKRVSFVYMGYAEKSIYSNHKYRHVVAKHARVNRVSGYAYYDSGSIVMKLPPPIIYHRWSTIQIENKVSARTVARVYLHEIGHNLGLRHKQQIPVSNIKVDFWPDEKLPLKQVIEKPKPNIIDVRAARAQKKLDEWQRKLNRAKTFVKKYQRKVRYYERKAAANK